jgi:exoribonuclease-2
MLLIAQAYATRRRENGSVEIDLPEAGVRVEGDAVVIRPVAPLQSRLLVENAMILTGEAVARFGAEHEIPVPYATQEAPDERAAGDGLAGMYALRRSMQRSQFRTAPGPHSGLGLEAYVQVTSPLRRYLDLVVHQQIRAFLESRPPLTAAQVLERIGAVEAMSGSMRQAEQLSNRHWTLVYLLQHPGWRGNAVLVGHEGSTAPSSSGWRGDASTCRVSCHRRRSGVGLRSWICAAEAVRSTGCVKRSPQAFDHDAGFWYAWGQSTRVASQLAVSDS